jgi:hypothetical protein
MKRELRGGGVSGPNNLEAPGFQSIELSMDQWEIDLSYSFGF